jgi:hypothetical protein
MQINSIQSGDKFNTMSEKSSAAADKFNDLGVKSGKNVRVTNMTNGHNQP